MYERKVESVWHDINVTLKCSWAHQLLITIVILNEHLGNGKTVLKVGHLVVIKIILITRCNPIRLEVTINQLNQQSSLRIKWLSIVMKSTNCVCLQYCV